MKVFHLYLLFFLLLALPVHASDVKFRSGGVYQIRCAEWPTGCIAPRAGQAEALAYVFAPSESNWWRISLQADGTFLLQHEATKRYLTYDGRRSDVLRYASLTRLQAGTASSWRLESAQEGFVLRNDMQRSHLINVRPGSMLVGTYAEHKEWPDGNEQLFLVDRKGRVVNLIGSHRVNLTDRCTDSKGRALALGQPETRSIRSEGEGRWLPVQQPGGEVNGENGWRTSNAVPVPASSVPRKVTNVSSPSGGSLRIMVDGRPAAFDSRTSTFLATVPVEALKGAMKTTIVAEGLSSADSKALRCFVDGVSQGRGGQCRFMHPAEGRTFRLAWVNASGGDTLAQTRIRFTALPILQLGAEGVNDHSYQMGSVTLSDAGHRGSFHDGRARLRYRGEYTSRYPKRSFSLKLVDAEGKKLNRSLCGLRSDNHWVLDAMANDPSRLRNRLCQDLWLGMAPRPYYAAHAKEKAVMGARGCFVEVFFNDRYQGLYHLEEPIDRKQLALAKDNRGNTQGRLYKGHRWTGEVNMRQGSWMAVPPAAPQEEWAGWELRCPNEARERKASDWQPLCEAVSLVTSASDVDFGSQVDEHFALDAVADYFLFLDFVFAIDNSGKNLYWAVHDVRRSNRLTPVPWDLDATWGLSWDGTHLSDRWASADLWNDYLRGGECVNGLWKRLQQVRPEVREHFRRRYRQLRSTLFSPSAVMARVDAYYRLFHLSGVEKREAERWNGTSCSRFVPGSERQHLQQWLERRLDHLDRTWLSTGQ